MAFSKFLNDNLPIKSQVDKTTKNGYVEFGYGQVEPNHLSAQRTGQIYAQLPANKDIEILEQGQFVKYDYAANDNGIGEVNFTGDGEWMLVYNETKLYKRHFDGTLQWDCEFAMIKDDYEARVYSPYDYEHTEQEFQTKYLNGVDANGKSSITLSTAVTLNSDKKTVTIDDEFFPVTYDADTETYTLEYNGETYTSTTGTFANVSVTYTFDDVTTDLKDIYEFNWTNDPYKKLGIYKEKKMPAGTKMVPRVFKTNVGDIFTTNTLADDEYEIGDVVAPRAADGILAKAGQTDKMKWQVVKLYTMPDGQQGVKLMRIA